MTSETTTQFKVGQFYRYTPLNSWCREGFAEVTERGTFDTYWGSSPTENSPLSRKELATAVLLFDSADYDELDRHGGNLSRHRWEQFSPADRQRITEQHGCRCRWFVKKGAKPDINTKIENARRELAEAEENLRSATMGVQWKQEALDRLLAEALTVREDRAE